VGSVTHSNERLSEHVLVASGSWRSGDAFLLLTDAMAAWFLRQREQRRAVRLPAEADFGAWVAEQRESGQLKNDDVTAMRVEVR
jgi:hypothetical protein